MKLSYRPEIDGLRTIAVLSVILYHAQIMIFGHDFFKGGFVGVDIFFVISGYLISRILLSELFEKGKISFLQFYERRARRILPILFTVFIVSFPLAYKYFLPNQFIEYAHSILSSTFFGSNIFFYFTNTQYGAEDSLLQPFLHTWSLGVEEQFYILFPIVLLLAYKFAKNHLLTIIAILILISLQYADWQSTRNTQLNFFMLTSRLWELGIGSLLAFYELKYGRVKHELLNQTMPLLGLAMITHAIVFFNNQTPHPSFITLLPTLGTALIILYSVNKADLVGKVLSLKPIVGIGLISYSMYLWHYPIFAFARIGDISGLHNDEKYLLILLTIVLSIVSFFIIEKPFRNRQKLSKKYLFYILTISTIIVITICTKIIVQNKNINIVNDLLEERNNYRLNVCGTKNQKCNENKKILFVGDSMVVDALNILLSTEKVNYEFNTVGGCPPIKDYKLLGNEHPYKNECIKLNNERFKIDYNKYFAVIIMNRFAWFKPEDIEEYVAHLKKENVKKVLIIGDGISLDKNFSEVIQKNNFEFEEDLRDKIKPGIEDKKIENLANKYEYEFLSIKKSIYELIKEMEVNHKKINILIDQHHLTLETSKYISERNKKKLKKFLER